MRRYNLFVSRIAQLKEEFGTNLVEVTTLLLEKLAPGLGGRPFITPPTDLDRLIINPDHCELSPCPAIEIASSGVLSACALIRQISRPEEPPPRQLSGIFKLERKLSNHHIVGTLHESNIP
ncbi:MAG: hypothetical protein GWO23_21875, partial [Gammaproteobacteria bacterium]|nr:hypothetical protein [Gammaproteobacteria bacterium]